MLEKFSKEPISPEDEHAAHMLLCDFIIAELGVPYIVEEKVFKNDEEKIPNTIAPYHFTINARIDASAWLRKVA